MTEKGLRMNIVNILLGSIIVIVTSYCIWLKVYQRRLERNLLQRSGLKLQINSSDIMDYIRRITDGFLPLMESRKIDFIVKCSPDSMMGWIDAEKIEKTILLIIANMVSQAKENGKIMLNAYTNQKYDKMTIRIADNGAQIDNLTLMMTHYLIRLHHGTLRNEYLEGQGNNIIIELPIKKDAFRQEQIEGQQPAFHIPQDIKLNIPTIELPSDVTEADKSLGAIVQQAYVSADKVFLKRAVQCVTEHMTDSDFDRDAFAAAMGMSVSTLYNKVRATSGKNVTNFIRDIRIKTACRLVKEHPEMRVSDIAYHVGFKDPKYFATSFKRVMGIQPKEYLSQVRGKTATGL